VCSSDLTDVGGNAEAVADNESGFLVPSENSEIVAERILQLLRNPAQALEMGSTGRSIVATRFTAQAMIKRHIEIYDELLDSRR
jgi:glycosyltransferase involved in cell wall biosynthesis